ncbi:MAG: hypothetical protein ACLQDV_01695 [Candidatus Binataceae bacterium]
MREALMVVSATATTTSPDGITKSVVLIAPEISERWPHPEKTRRTKQAPRHKDIKEEREARLEACATGNCEAGESIEFAAFTDLAIESPAHQVANDDLFHWPADAARRHYSLALLSILMGSLKPQRALASGGNSH